MLEMNKSLAAQGQPIEKQIGKGLSNHAAAIHATYLEKMARHGSIEQERRANGREVRDAVE